MYAESYYAGGLIGTINSKVGSKVSFKNCTTDITVTSYYNVGSLFGTSSGSTAVFTLTDCTNTGDMSAKGTIGEFVGFLNCGTGSTYSNLKGKNEIAEKYFFGSGFNNIKCADSIETLNYDIDYLTDCIE